MNFKRIIAAVALSAASAVSFAAPVYWGDTEAAGLSNSDIDTGYYIWNDENDGSKWSVRWSSTNAVPGNRVDWFGSIIVESNGLGSVSEYLFESNDDSFSASLPGVDLIGWEAVTNDTGGIDGIDFTLNDYATSLDFRLGSSLFNHLEPAFGAEGVQATNIFVGDTFATPDVYVIESRDGVYQSFEVAVSEPGTIALLGLGLAGLGFARRQQAKA